MRKTYIIAPGFSMSPNRLCLGDIIADPLGPEIVPLNQYRRIKIPEGQRYDVDKKEKVSLGRKDLLSGRLGVWAQLLGWLGLPVGLDAGIFLERNSADIIKADTMETHEFAPTVEYLNQVITLDSVDAFLQSSQYAAKLYMVTGLKIVKNASLTKDAGTTFDVTIGPSSDGGVVDLKPALQFLSQRTNGITFEGSTDFILAFRVREVRVRVDKSTNDKLISHKLSTKGASMMDGGFRSDKINHEVIGLGSEFPPGLDSGLDAVMDGAADELWMAPDVSQEQLL